MFAAPPSTSQRSKKQGKVRHSRPQTNLCPVKLRKLQGILKTRAMDVPGEKGRKTVNFLQQVTVKFIDSSNTTKVPLMTDIEQQMKNMTYRNLEKSVYRIILNASK